MKYFQQTLLVTALMAGAISVTGCGDSSSNSHGTLTAPPADTKTTIAIGNTSDQAYARFILLDQNGNTLANQEINCRAKQTDCKVFLSTEVKQTSTLIVEDSNRRLIRAFKFPEQILPYSDAYPSSFTTGRFLFEKLQRDYFAKNRLTQEDLNLRLLNFFQNYDSPDGRSDFFEEVGDYYAKQTANNSLTEKDFLESFSKRLIDWEIAKPEELPKLKKQANLSPGQKLITAYKSLISGESSLISTAHASTTTGSCSPLLKSFLSLGEGAAKGIPGAGGAISAAFGVGTKACAGDPMGDIRSQLIELTVGVKDINDKVAKLSQFTFNKAIREETTAFQGDYNAVDRYASNFVTFLNNNGNVKTLEEYFTQKGSWDKAIADGGTALQGLLQPSDLVINLIQRTTKPTIDTYFDALNKQCAGSAPTGSPDNYIDVRESCNGYIAANLGYLAGSEAVLSDILKDVYKVLAKYEAIEGAAKVSNRYPLPNQYASKYATAHDDIQTKFKKEQDAFVNKLKSSVGHRQTGWFDLYDGLNQNLQKNLVNRKCAFPGTRIPAITGWYAPGSTANTHYIATQCTLTTFENTNKLIKAKYYLDQQGGVDANDVFNVLGVPVAGEYVRTLSALDKKNHNSTNSDYVNFGKLYVEAPTLIAFSNNAQAHLASGFIPAEDKAGVWGGLHRVNGQPNRYLIDVPWGYHDARNWVLVKDKNDDGFSRVATLRLDYTRDEGGRASRVSYFLSCVASGCRVDPGTEHWLLFDSGLTLDAWNLGRNIDGNPALGLGPVGSVK